MRSFLIIGAIIAQLAVLPAQFVTHNLGGLRGTVTSVEGDLPTPLFEGNADSDSYNWTGSEGSGECTLTTATIDEDPDLSTTYGLELDGASGRAVCGDGVDGVNDGPATIFAWVRHDNAGEGVAGRIFFKQDVTTQAKSWDINVSGTVGACTTGMCIEFLIFEGGGGARVWRSPANSFNVTGSYRSVAVTWDCSSTTIQSCTPTMYIDGSPVSLGNNGGTGTIVADDSAYEIILGNQVADDRTFDGHIKRILVFDQELSSGQISTLDSQGEDGP